MVMARWEGTVGLPMLPGHPTQLLPAVPLRALIGLAPPGEVLGAWVRGCHRALRLHTTAFGHVRRLLAAHDLGFLLRRCGRIAIRDGSDIAVLSADRLIAWRTLQIVIGAPYLPDLQQLRALYPDLRVSGRRIAVTIGPDSGQAALAACAAGRLPVVATWIDYSGSTIGIGVTESG
jgi:hypothetical protein